MVRPSESLQIVSVDPDVKSLPTHGLKCRFLLLKFFPSKANLDAVLGYYVLVLGLV